MGKKEITLQVEELFKRGMSNKEIVQELNISNFQAASVVCRIKNDRDEKTRRWAMKEAMQLLSKGVMQSLARRNKCREEMLNDRQIDRYSRRQQDRLRLLDAT